MVALKGQQSDTSYRIVTMKERNQCSSIHQNCTEENLCAQFSFLLRNCERNERLSK